MQQKDTISGSLDTSKLSVGQGCSTWLQEMWPCVAKNENTQQLVLGLDITEVCVTMLALQCQC